MSDTAMFSLFFGFFLSSFVLSVAMVISEITFQKDTIHKKDRNL